jgi:hypothetical protein
MQPIISFLCVCVCQLSLCVCIYQVHERQREARAPARRGWHTASVLQGGGGGAGGGAHQQLLLVAGHPPRRVQNRKRTCNTPNTHTHQHTLISTPTTPICWNIFYITHIKNISIFCNKLTILVFGVSLCNSDCACAVCLQSHSAHAHCNFMYLL